jgi:D-glycero-alpha-D-manno-heptose 1-phosphate guanylyltransferase
MVQEVIILAGGLGTRLQSVVGDVPKCMAPINGIPFIDFVITYLKGEGITRFIFSLGHKSNIVISHIDATWKDIEKVYVVEDKQLGTGGAIKKACEVATNENILVVNGDTLFNIDVAELGMKHFEVNAECTVALSTIYNAKRYGTIELTNEGLITSFNENQFTSEALINGGMYYLNKIKFLQKAPAHIFSFEQDYLKKYVSLGNFYGLLYRNYFIDIGVPEDYLSFQEKSNAVTNKPKSNSSSNSGGLAVDALSLFIQLLD